MPYRWITEEEWLRTGGVPKESSHVSPEGQEELRVAPEVRRKRLRIGTAALTFGGLGLLLAAMFYAFEVVDQQALRAFKALPHIILPEPATETVGSDAASPAVSDRMPVTQQTATGKTAPVTDPMPNTQQKVQEHHGSKTHGGRFGP